jgi:hypothetical protein
MAHCAECACAPRANCISTHQKSASLKDRRESKDRYSHCLWSGRFHACCNIVVSITASAKATRPSPGGGLFMGLWLKSASSVLREAPPGSWVDLNRSENRSAGQPLAFTAPHSATAPCSKGWLIRCTVPGLTSNCLAMTRTPGLPGVARASRIHFSSAGAIRVGSLCMSATSARVSLRVHIFPGYQSK